MSPPIIAWHFCVADGRMRDGRTYAPIGTWQSIEDPSRLELCVYGYHASRRVSDALRWARSVDTCAELVELSGWRQADDDKDCCQRRRALARLSEADTELVLRLHAIWCAGWALHRYYPAGPSRTNLIRSLRKYATALRSLDCSRESAARSAVRRAAWNAIESAGEKAAWNADERAAWNADERAAWNAASAARSATEDAYGYASAASAAAAAIESAAESAAWSAVRTRSLIWNADERAAWNAVRNAAKNAAERALKRRFAAAMRRASGDDSNSGGESWRALI